MKKYLNDINYFQNYIFKDLSTLVLIFSNLIVIFLAVRENWDLGTVIWVYWFQSVIIGFFNFIRILKLKDFSTEGFDINITPNKPSEGYKILTAGFFALHYGFFHFCYAAILIGFIGFMPQSTFFSNMSYIILGAAIFFINHLFSFLYNRERDEKKQNIGRVFYYPYIRIVPMHLTLMFGGQFMLFGGGTQGVLVFSPYTKNNS